MISFFYFLYIHNKYSYAHFLLHIKFFLLSLHQYTPYAHLFFFEKPNCYNSKTNGWFTNFFNDKDCRIVIKKMELNKNHFNIQLLLLPSTRRSYKLAHEQYEEFDQNIKSYFDKNIHLHIKTTLLTMITGTCPRRKRGK